MNKVKLSAVRRTSSLDKPTAVAERNLVLALGGALDSGIGVGRVPVSATCPHVEYPASA